MRTEHGGIENCEDKLESTRVKRNSYGSLTTSKDLPLIIDGPAGGAGIFIR